MWLATVALSLIVLVSLLLPTDTHYDRKARIGASDDLSGLVLDYMQRSDGFSISDYIEPYFIRDC